MPIVKTYYPTKAAVIGIWQITETLAQLEKAIELSKADKITYQSFTVEKRKKEWLCVRILLKELTNENLNIFYDENRKPFLKDTALSISISHSKNYVALYLDKNKQLGIDIEEPREQILKITNKFLSPTEMAYLTEENKLSKGIILWCIKEAMYKFYSKRLLDFKTELAIEPFELKLNGMVWGLIIKENYKKLLAVNYVCEQLYSIAFVAGD